MPPFYPNQHDQNNQNNQYNNGDAYYDQYNQYQYNGYPVPAPQPIPAYSQIQVNVPAQMSSQPYVPSAQQYQQHASSYTAYQQPNQAFYQSDPTTAQYHQSYQPQPDHHAQQYPLQLPPQPLMQSPQTPVPRPIANENHQTQRPEQQHQSQLQTQHRHQHQHPNQHDQLHHPHQPRQHQHQGQLQQQHHYQQSPFRLQPQAQPQPQSQATQPPRILQDVQPNKSRQMPTSVKPDRDHDENESEPDYALLLLNLADEYLEAASKLSSRAEEYFKLTATALGCIQSVLQNFQLPPLREAQVRLRYAHLLYSETDNNDDAETILTKTVESCERMKFIDLKYAAQLLLAQVLHRSNPKAAIKDVQGIIQDAEAYRHSAWEYAFRLQLVSFYMATSLPTDLHAATTQLERLGHTAKQNNDHAVYAFAATLETLVALQTSGTDSTQNAQRALAKARAMQLNDDVASNPQMMIMMEFLDLCGHLKEFDITQGEPKRKIMQSVLYSTLENPGWRSDGLMYIPINRNSLRGLQTQDGGIIVEQDGKYHLALAWLPKEEVEDLGYLLSGVSAASKNAGDNGKAEKFLDEGLEMLKDMAEEKIPVTMRGDVIRDRRAIAKSHFLLERVFLQCSKGQWAKANTSITTIDRIASNMTAPYPAEMRFLVDYTKGAVAQGQGKIDEALNIFAAQIKRLQPQTSTVAGNRSTTAQKKEEIYRNTAILAAMNTTFIIQHKTHPQHHRLQQLVNMLDPLVHNSANKTIQAAWNFILAVLPNNSILKTKQYLSHALNAAQAINNAQVTTLCLTAMHDRFFQGVLGDQALKCARAATHQAKKLNEPMWISVTTGLEAQCLDVHGMSEEAHKKRDESTRMMNMLPEKVKAI